MLGICTVYIAQILRNVFVKDQTANGTINNLRNPLITNISGNPYFNLCVNGNIAFIVGHEGFVDIGKSCLRPFRRPFPWSGNTNPKPYPVSEQQLDDRQTASTSCSQPASGILLLPVLADSGRCTAIWSPSKSALNAEHTNGCSFRARPSTSTGSNA